MGYTHYTNNCNILKKASYTFKPNINVQYTRFIKRLFFPDCFEKLPGRLLVGHAQRAFTTPSIMTCQEECRYALDFYCKSISYYKKEQRCILNRDSKDKYPKWLLYSNNTVYYDNYCKTPRREKRHAHIIEIPGAELKPWRDDRSVEDTQPRPMHPPTCAEICGSLPKIEVL